MENQAHSQASDQSKAKGEPPANEYKDCIKHHFTSLASPSMTSRLWATS